MTSGPGFAAALARAWRMLVHVVPSQIPLLSAVPVTTYVSALACGAITSVAAAAAKNIRVRCINSCLLASEGIDGGSAVQTNVRR